VSPLETLLIVYIMLLVLNAGVSVVLWSIYRKPILIQLIGVWGFTLLNFLSQAVTLQSPLGSILGFSSYMLVAWCLCTILAEVTDKPLNFRPFFVGYLLGLGAFAALAAGGAGFTLMALPVAIAVAAPQLFWALRVLRQSTERDLALVKWFAAILLINGLHFLDYPFLRPIPEAAVFGYSIVIATCMLFGILLPCIINNFLSNQLARQLLEEIESHKATELQLEDALASAEKSSKAKTIFLANMSHEIRTPINGIVGLNDLLLESTLTQQQRGYAQQVKRSGDELLNIVNNILTLAQLESSEVPLHMKRFSLQHLVNDVISHYEVRGTGGCCLRIDPQSQLQVWVVADDGKIKQILYNLINNAIKHSQASEIRCLVTFECFRPGEGELTLAITDNGQGIPKHKIAKLSRRFEQDEYSAKGGVGLGLSIVIEMIGAMEGSFFIDSDEGRGLTAHCSIPVALAPSGEYVAPKSHELAPQASKDETTLTASHVHLEPMRSDDDTLILIVEDNPVNQLVIEGMLKKLQLPFRLAVNGAQAMELYHQNRDRLRCVLMDIQLPDASGLDLIAQIRATGDTVGILVLSAFAFSEDEDKALAVGANGYLRKPYHFDHLKKALQQIDQKVPVVIDPHP
jgi:signal transduction histidine kinase/CheY-like chemotaxis protein